jgi:small subunit ribosomal protein S9
MVGMAKTKQKQKKTVKKTTAKHVVKEVKETAKPVKEAVKPVKEHKEVKSTVQPKKVEKVEKAAEPRAPKKAKTAHVAHLALATGRRKSSVARAFLKRGTGKLIVNEKDYTTYFDTEITRESAIFPMVMIPQAKHYDVHVDVKGGGLWGQADAVKLAIARALLIADESLKSVLREHGLLTVDARVKERKKYGQKAARRRFQFVKR